MGVTFLVGVLTQKGSRPRSAIRQGALLSAQIRSERDGLIHRLTGTVGTLDVDLELLQRLATGTFLDGAQLDAQVVPGGWLELEERGLQEDLRGGHRGDVLLLEGDLDADRSVRPDLLAELGDGA